MENSSFQSAPASGLRKDGIGRLPDMVKYVKRDGIGAGGDHHVHLGGDALLSEIEDIGGFLTSPHDLFGAYISKRLAWTDCGAHRPLADGGPVVTHVAFHHLLALGKDFWDTERARQDTIRAADAARLQGRLHDPVLALLDGVGRADHRAGRIVAVPADICRRGDRSPAVDEIEIDHRLPSVRFALFAGVQAGLAADAARRVHVEFIAVHQAIPFASSVTHSGGPAAFRNWHADTLNSGILLRGSSVRCVSLLALRPPGQ